MFCLVGADLYWRSAWRSFAYMICFQCYFKPGELANLKTAEVIAPVAGRTTVRLCLGPNEEQIGVNTGQLDKSVLTDLGEVPGS